MAKKALGDCTPNSCIFFLDSYKYKMLQIIKIVMCSFILLNEYYYIYIYLIIDLSISLSHMCFLPLDVLHMQNFQYSFYETLQ